MKQAIRQVAKTGWTNDRYLLALSDARNINEAHGAPVVSALDVQMWPTDWVDALTTYNQSADEIREHESKLKKSRNEWLKRNEYRRLKAGLN